MKVLVCNVGSTSLKFKLYDMPGDRVLAQGRMECVGSPGDGIVEYTNRKTGVAVRQEHQSISDYRQGIEWFLDDLLSPEYGVLSSVEEIQRVGYKATLSKGYFGIHELTPDVVEGMRAWLPLAPLHNEGYLQAIEAMRAVLPKALFVGAFETSFHREIPLERKLYGVPYEWYEQYGVQRLGYHSASHSYIATVLDRRTGGTYRAISCHLGGSSSVCAILNGKSVDTSFGMSLQSGLIHATRVGDMDCDLYRFLESQGLDQRQIRDGFENQGGLLGISGISGDVRYLEQAARQGNRRAELALDVLVNGIVHYVGAFYADLEGLDYLVFTAGIGENSWLVREKVCRKLRIFGVELDPERNRTGSGERELTREGSAVSVLVIPTDEELGIARATFQYGGQGTWENGQGDEPRKAAAETQHTDTEEE